MLTHEGLKHQHKFVEPAELLFIVLFIHLNLNLQNFPESYKRKREAIKLIGGCLLSNLGWVRFVEIYFWEMFEGSDIKWSGNHFPCCEKCDSMNWYWLSRDSKQNSLLCSLLLFLLKDYLLQHQLFKPIN